MSERKRAREEVETRNVVLKTGDGRIEITKEKCSICMQNFSKEKIPEKYEDSYAHKECARIDRRKKRGEKLTKMHNDIVASINVDDEMCSFCKKGEPGLVPCSCNPSCGAKIHKFCGTPDGVCPEHTCNECRRLDGIINKDVEQQQCILCKKRYCKKHAGVWDNMSSECCNACVGSLFKTRATSIDANLSKLSVKELDDIEDQSHELHRVYANSPKVPDKCCVMCNKDEKSELRKCENPDCGNLFHESHAITACAKCETGSVMRICSICHKSGGKLIPCDKGLCRSVMHDGCSVTPTCPHHNCHTCAINGKYELSHERKIEVDGALLMQTKCGCSVCGRAFCMAHIDNFTIGLRCKECEARLT